MTFQGRPMIQAGPGIALSQPAFPGQEAELTSAALGFLAELHRQFEASRQARLAERLRQAAAFDAGALPDFRADTAAIRAGDWRVAEIPAALRDRRVEITGPAAIPPYKT